MTDRSRQQGHDPLRGPGAGTREQPDALLPSTGRLVFRRWTDGDFELARRLWGDPEVTRYMMRGPLDDDGVRARLAREAASLARLGVQYWPMFERATGALVGAAGLKACPYEGTPEAPELEMGFHLTPAFWGQGLATEAAHAIARLAFERLGAPRLYAGHHPENRASANVLRKLGFVHHRDVFFEPTGLMHPLLVLARNFLAPAPRRA